MNIWRCCARANKQSFLIPPIKDVVGRYCHGVIVDPFSGQSTLAQYSNDIDPDSPSQYHLHCNEFLDMLIEQGVVADCILFDPPYSPRQISEHYKHATQSDTQNGRLYRSARERCDILLKVGGYAITLGWCTPRFARSYQFIELGIICHGGAHNDTLITVQQKTQRILDFSTPSAKGGEGE